MQLTAGADLNSVVVYPNPYRPGSGGNYDNTVYKGVVAQGVVFSGLTSKANIKIFNVAGELVAELNEADGDGLCLWDAKNSGGDKAASGVYIYYIKNPDNPAANPAKGRFAVIK